MRTFGGGRWGYLCSLCLLLGVLARTAMATVVLIGPNVTMSFGDIEANFAPPISSSGIHGVLYLAEPLDACSSLTKKVSNVSSPPLALIIRGDCPFDEKVRNAQDAGFKSAIIYDDEDDGLIAMAGSPSGIAINAVFVAKSTGEVLKRYSGNLNMEVWILPNFDNSAWSILAISFISLLAMLAVLATCYFVRRHSVRHQRPRAPSREPPGMSSQSVKAMPSLIFTTVLEDNCTSATCAICLEDYNVGDTLRILPCRHKFHALCVDMWLTSWRTFCPVCKRDARTNVDKPPPSECTPLLSAGPASPSSPESSFHSSRPASPPVQVSLRMPRPPTSRIHSLSSTPHMLHQHRSYSASPPIHISRSSADLRNMSSLRSHASHLMSPHSLGVPFSSPVTSRFASPYIRSSGNGSPSYLVGSSSRHHFLPHSESARSSSAVASAESLPEC